MKIKQSMLLVLVVGYMHTTLFSSETCDTSIDIRTVLENHHSNKRDKNGNTPLHLFALTCDKYKENDAYLMTCDLDKLFYKRGIPPTKVPSGPNPFMLNNCSKTARQEAETRFKQTGNLICWNLAESLKEKEKIFAKRCANKASREEFVHDITAKI